MRIYAKLSQALVAVAFALVSSMSSAIPIPSGNSPADNLIINFDFGSSTPPPPYTQILVRYQWSDFDAGDQIVIDYFSALDGVDLHHSITQPNAWFISAFFVDGQFSVGIRMPSGEANLVDIHAVAYISAVEVARVQGPFTSTSVPEPTTAALLMIGLAGLGVARRKAGRSFAQA